MLHTVMPRRKDDGIKYFMIIKCDRGQLHGRKSHQEPANRNREAETVGMMPPALLSVLSSKLPEDSPPHSEHRAFPAQSCNLFPQFFPKQYGKVCHSNSPLP